MEKWEQRVIYGGWTNYKQYREEYKAFQADYRAYKNSGGRTFASDERWDDVEDEWHDRDEDWRDGLIPWSNDGSGIFKPLNFAFARFSGSYGDVVSRPEGNKLLMVGTVISAPGTTNLIPVILGDDKHDNVVGKIVIDISNSRGNDVVDLTSYDGLEEIARYGFDIHSLEVRGLGNGDVIKVEDDEEYGITRIHLRSSAELGFIGSGSRPERWLLVTTEDDRNTAYLVNQDSRDYPTRGLIGDDVVIKVTGQDIASKVRSGSLDFIEIN